MTTFHFQPIKGKAKEIITAILQAPEISSCRTKDALVLRLACEEMVVNVTSYAYPPDDEGWLDVQIQKTDRVVIRFEDGGVPFNPLEQKMPDTSLSWKKRRIGGLGVFLLRRKMDDIRYAYEDHKNILSIEKVISKL